MLARPFILQAEMLARICPRIASLSENIRQKTSSRVDTRLVSVASESDRGSIPLLSYNGAWLSAVRDVLSRRNPAARVWRA